MNNIGCSPPNQSLFWDSKSCIFCLTPLLFSFYLFFFFFLLSFLAFFFLSLSRFPLVIYGCNFLRTSRVQKLLLRKLDEIQWWCWLCCCVFCTRFHKMIAYEQQVHFFLFFFFEGIIHLFMYMRLYICIYIPILCFNFLYFFMLLQISTIFVFCFSFLVYYIFHKTSFTYQLMSAVRCYGKPCIRLKYATIKCKMRFLFIYCIKICI